MFRIFGYDRIQFRYSLCCSDAGPVNSVYWQIIEDLPSLSDKQVLLYGHGKGPSVHCSSVCPWWKRFLHQIQEESIYVPAVHVLKLEWWTRYAGTVLW